MIILGIESTCDETAASLVEDGRHLLSNVISTSVKEQALYGGVVPEIASRRHCEFISATVKKALLDAGKTIDDVDAVAVTFAPGLIGAVLVGVNFAKGLAYSAGKPLVPVHHLRGHIAALYLLSLIHISEPTRRTPISYAVFCLKKKKQNHSLHHLFTTILSNKSHPCSKSDI